MQYHVQIRQVDMQGARRTPNGKLKSKSAATIQLTLITQTQLINSDEIQLDIADPNLWDLAQAMVNCSHIYAATRHPVHSSDSDSDNSLSGKRTKPTVDEILAGEGFNIVKEVGNRCR